MYTVSSFTEPRSSPLNDPPEAYIKMIARIYKTDKPINVTGINKTHLKCDCSNGFIANGIREPILYSFALDKPPGHKIFKGPRIKLFKKLSIFFCLISHFI